MGFLKQSGFNVFLHICWIFESMLLIKKNRIAVKTLIELKKVFTEKFIF